MYSYQLKDLLQFILLFSLPFSSCMIDFLLFLKFFINHFTLYKKIKIKRILRIVVNTGQPLPVGTANYAIPAACGMPREFGILFPNSQTINSVMVLVAKLIIFTIGPHSNCQKYLTQFMKYIEPYYHPSNHGDWSSRLGKLMQVLCKIFARRVSREEKNKKKHQSFMLKTQDEHEHENLPGIVPDHFSRYLNDNNIDEFVNCMIPIIMKALYSKSRQLGSAANDALKHLAFIRPNLVLPQLLDTIIPDLQSIEQTHRTQAALEVLGVATRPLLWRKIFPNGGQYLSDLLCLTLPGIDPNDLMKSLATIRFYTTFLINVPLFDCSMVNNENNNPNYHLLDDDDKGAILSTCYFSDWSIDLLERILTLYSYTVSSKKNNYSFSLESAVHEPTLRLSGLLFMQSSPIIFDRLISYLFHFVTTTQISSATREIGDLCEYACFANPCKTLQLFIPYYYDILVLKTKENQNSLNYLSDNEMEWILTILLKIIKRAGIELLKYKQKISDILEITLLSSKTSRKLLKLSSKLLRSLLNSLTLTYLLEERSLPPSIWNSDDFQQNSYKYWGYSADPKNLEVQWHYPSNDEILWANELIEKFGIPVINQLNQFVDEKENTNISNKNNNSTTSTNNHHDDQQKFQLSSKDRNELYKNLIILRMILHGSSSILKSATKEEEDSIQQGEFLYDFNEKPENYDNVTTTSKEEDINENNIKPITSNPITLTIIGKLICRLSLLLDDCDDTKILILIIKILDKILNSKCGKSPERKHEMIVATFKSIGASHLTYKESVRYFNIHLGNILHQSRLYIKNFSFYFSKLYCNIFFCLIKFSVHRYVKVRSYAQQISSISIIQFNLSASFVCPQIFKYLSPESPSNYLTGIIYLLHYNSKLLSEIFGNWQIVSEFLIILCNCYKHDQLNVQKRILSLFDFISDIFYTSPIRLTPIASFSDKIDEKIKIQLENKSKENEKIYYSLIDTLCNFKLPWNYTIGIGNFLLLLIRDDFLPSLNLVSFFHLSLTSDIILHRRLGYGGLSRILLVYKPIHKTFKNSRTNNYSNHQIQRLSVKEFQKRISNDPLNENQWENADFQEKNYFHWAQIPSSWNSYSPMNDIDHKNQMERIHSISSLSNLVSSFLSDSWWDFALSRLSTEVQLTTFQKSIAQFYKGVFQVFYDHFLDLLKPKLNQLIFNFDDNGSQVLASHIIAGLVRGSKHWPYDKIEKLWDYVLPIFDKVLEYSNSENFQNWLACINFCVYDRDPRRLYRFRKHFISAVQLSDCDFTTYGTTQTPTPRNHDKMDHDQEDERSSATSSPLDNNKMKKLSTIHLVRRIQALTGLISELSWRGSFYGDSIIDKIQKQILIDGKLIRNSLALLAGSILSSNFDGCRDPHSNLPNFTSGKEYINPKLKEFVNHLIQQLEITKEKSERKNLSKDEILKSKKEYTNCCKFVLNWILSGFQLYVVHTLFLYLPPLLPKIFEMRSEDPNVMNLLFTVTGYIANAEMSHSLAIYMLNVCYHLLSNSNSWHVKATILPFMQVLVFKNIFILSDHVPLVVNSLVSSLVDPQFEVRDLASVSLSGVLKFIEDSSFILYLKDKFLEMASTSLPTNVKNRKTNSSFNNNLLTRHGGVLGLSSLTLLNPYEIPEWLPDLLVSLATHIHDPMPIRVFNFFVLFFKIFSNFVIFRALLKELFLNFGEFTKIIGLLRKIHFLLLNLQFLLSYLFLHLILHKKNNINPIIIITSNNKIY